VGNHNFQGTDTTPLTIHVPAGSQAAYMTWLANADNAAKLAFPAGKPVIIDDGSGAYAARVAGANLSDSADLADLYNGFAAAIPTTGTSPDYTGGLISLDLSACAASDGTITGVNTSTLPQATCARFVAITLPDTVTTLVRDGSISAGVGPFGRFANLQSITANGVTEIGMSAFKYSVKLPTVSFPLATQIGNNAFDECAALTTVSLPAANTIGSSAFAYCAALTDLTLGATPPGFADYADFIFSGTETAPLTIHVPTGSQAAYAAWLANNAAALAFPAGKPVIIDDGSGAYAARVAGRDLSNSVVLAALYNGVAGAIASGYISLDLSACTGATVSGVNTTTLPIAIRNRFAAITLPDTVTNLVVNGDIGAFEEFHNLQRITAGGVTTVGDFAFFRCENLATVSFPHAETIGQSAFAHCYGLTTVSLPAAQTIGIYAFYNDSALTDLFLGAAPPPTLVSSLFDYPGAGRTLTIRHPATGDAAARDAGEGWVTENADHWGTTDAATITQGTYTP
jgi:hypothetical protein